MRFDFADFTVERQHLLARLADILVVFQRQAHGLFQGEGLALAGASRGDRSPGASQGEGNEERERTWFHRLLRLVAAGRLEPAPTCRPSSNRRGDVGR